MPNRYPSAAVHSGPGHRGPLLRRQALAFVLGAGIPLLLAFEDGGYGVLVRQKLGLVVWVAIALGLALGLLPRARISRAGWVALGALAVLGSLTALSLLWTDSGERTYEELCRVLQYTGLLVLALAGLNRFTWRGAAAGLALAALALPFFSLTARLAPDLITDATARDLGIDRLSYPFGYWNAVAAWGAMAIAIGIVLSAHLRQTALRAAVLAAVPVAGVVVYLTYSRGGVISAAFAVAVAIALSRNRWTAGGHTLIAAAVTGLAVLAVRNEPEIARATGDDGAWTVLLVLGIGCATCAASAVVTRFWDLDRWRLSRPAAGAVLALAVVVLGVAAAVGGADRISDAWNDFSDDRTTVAASPADPAARLGSLSGSRDEAWETALDAFSDHPAGGIGPGTYQFYWAQHGGRPEFITDAHSLYLETMAELGLPGILAVLALVLALVGGALAARREIPITRLVGLSGALTAALAVYLLAAGFDWFWELPALGALGLGAGATALAAGSSRYRRGLGRPLQIGLTVVAIAAAVAQVPPLVSSDRLDASADDLRAGRVDDAIDAASDSIDAEPWAASPHVQRALAEQEAGDFAAARSDLDRAVELEPDNWRHRFLLARLAASQGNRAAVVAELAEVKKLAPQSAFLLPGAPGREEIDKVLGARPSVDAQ